MHDMEVPPFFLYINLVFFVFVLIWILVNHRDLVVYFASSGLRTERSRGKIMEKKEFSVLMLLIRIFTRVPCIPDHCTLAWSQFSDLGRPSLGSDRTAGHETTLNCLRLVSLCRPEGNSEAFATPKDEMLEGGEEVKGILLILGEALHLDRIKCQSGERRTQEAADRCSKEPHGLIRPDVLQYG
ncbi:hypothetical protein ZWY2020_050990 [Hordeum vulgare]|nr:hypothetical protein ZWY2020_050990 [Hordeum vulgare]